MKIKWAVLVIFSHHMILQEQLLTGRAVIRDLSDSREVRESLAGVLLRKFREKRVF